MVEWGTGRRWPLVGRDDAVADIVTAIAEGQVGGIILSGPAGVGKTALAVAVMAVAEDAGTAAARVVATAAASAVPYGALAGMVHISDVPHARADLAAEVHHAVRNLGRGADGGRPLLVVDDLPLLDEASAAEVAALVRDGQVFLVGTARTGVPLASDLAGLEVEGALVRSLVTPLDRDGLVEAAERALGGLLDSQARLTLWDLSLGIPLHAREVVRTNLDTGVLVHGPTGWHFAGPVTAPPNLVELVSSRFLRLGAAQRGAYEALCLAQPIPVVAAEELAGLELLVELERSELVAVTIEGGVAQVRLGHPLYDEVVRASVGALGLRQAAGRAAAALEAIDAGDPDIGLRAACLRCEHQLPIDPERGLAAARRALVLQDPVLAEELLELAGPPSYESWLTLGTARTARGMVDDADLALAAAAETAENDEERARALSRRGINLTTGAGRFEEAAILLAAGLETVDDPRWRSFVAADLAYVRLWLGQRDGAMTAWAGDSVPDVVRANECLAGAVISAMAGELADAERLVAEGLPLAPSITADVPMARELLTLSRFLTLAFGGDHESAVRVLDIELERVLGGPDGASGTWLAARAVQRLIDGDLHGAIADADEATWRLDLVDVTGLKPLAQAVIAAARAQLGDRTGSIAAAESVDPAWRDETKVRTLLSQAAAWLAVLDGRTVEAAELLADAGRAAVLANHLPMGAIAAYDAVRLGRARPALEVLRLAARRWEGPLARALVVHAEAVVDGNASLLDDVSRQLPDLGFRIGAAEAAAQAARLHDAAGRTELARRSEYRASVLTEALGGLATCALGSPRGLTAREREVACAAAGGGSSRSIAEVLGLSVRTVDNHLAAVYRKVGVAGRSELADALESIPTQR